MLTTMDARAFVSWGRWVAACPNVPCNNAEELHPFRNYKCSHVQCVVRNTPEITFHCSQCHTVAPIEWPPNLDEIWAELQRRPGAANRNWFPHGHDLALKWNVPHGQSISELRDEFEQWRGQPQ